jgi:citrate lyase beta subunit
MVAAGSVRASRTGRSSSFPDTTAGASQLPSPREPFDRVYPRHDDPDGLEADARFARSLGFGGKACAAPAQPAIVNQVFEAFDRDAAAAAKAALFKHERG